MGGQIQRLLGWFPDTWRAIDAQAEAERAHGPPDGRVPQILVAAALILTFQWYWGDRPYFHELLGKRLSASPLGARYLELFAFSWWSAAKMLGFLLVPMIHVRLLGGRLRDFGLPLGRAEDLGCPGTRPPGWVYLALFLVVLPLLVLVSFTDAFRATYPFYRMTSRSWFDLLSWELQYGATFLSIEFFFRGYLLFGLRRAMGSHAIFVMMVPYCMIHVLKPAAESLGAIVAGIVLGTLALSTGSIWYGVLIHVSIAWSMDLLACWQGGAFPPPGKWLP